MGGFKVGAQVAIADALLDGHSSLKKGVISGILASELEQVLGRAASDISISAGGITYTLQQLLEESHQANVAAADAAFERRGLAERQLENSGDVAGLLHRLADLVDEYSGDVMRREIDAAERAIAESNPDYKRSFEALPDYVLLDMVMSYTQKMTDVPATVELWRFRAAATDALGYNFDYQLTGLGIDNKNLLTLVGNIRAKLR